MKFKRYMLLLSIIIILFTSSCSTISEFINNQNSDTMQNIDEISGSDEQQNENQNNDDSQTTNTTEEEYEADITDDEQKYEGLRILIKRGRTLNPLLSNDEVLCKTLGLVYQNIISYTSDNKIEYNLIDSCVFNPSNNEFIITVKQDMKWDDGQPITVNDFVYSYNYLKNAPETAYYKYVIQDIVSFTKINSTQISIKTTKPYAGNPYFLDFPIIPQHKKDVPDLSDEVHYNLIVGNGIYKNVQNDVNNIVYLTDNPEDNIDPIIKTVQLVPTENDESMYYGFEQGLANVLASTVSEWSKYHVDKSTNISSYNNMEMVTLGFNFNRSVNQDINFRNAVYYAIPFNQIANSIYLGYSDDSRTLYPNNHFAYNQIENNEKVDLIKADDYLELSSYEGQQLKLVTIENNKELIKASQIIQTNLNNININVEIVPLSFEDYKIALNNGDYDIYLGKFKMNVLPDFNKLIGQNNYSNFSNENVVNLINNLNSATSYDQYIEIANNLQNIIFEQKPIIPIVHTHDAIISSSYLDTSIPSSYSAPYNNTENWEIK